MFCPSESVLAHDLDNPRVLVAEVWYNTFKDTLHQHMWHLEPRVRSSVEPVRVCPLHQGVIGTLLRRQCYFVVTYN